MDGERDIDFTEQEEAWSEIDTRQHQVVISAVIDNDSEGEVRVWGDSVFCDAAMYMAELVDKKSEKHVIVNTQFEEKNKKLHKKSKKSKG